MKDSIACQLPPCYLTRCKADGSYENKQGSANDCWCVSQEGKQISRTRANCNSRTTCDGLNYGNANYQTSTVYSYETLWVIGAWLSLHVLASILFWMPALGGFYWAVLNAVTHDRKIYFREFFACFGCRYYCRLLGLSFVIKFFEALLLCLFLVPGLWWGFVTMFALPLHKRHRSLGVCGSIRLSMLVINRYFCPIICFLILLSLLQIVGFICLIVGLLYTFPMAFVAVCMCFHDLIGTIPEFVFPNAPADLAPVAVHV